MPTTNIFERTALFVRENVEKDGRKRIRRIPWDLIALDGHGFMVSPMPVSLSLGGEANTDTAIADVLDMDADDGQSDMIDDIVNFMFFDSETDFYARFENTFGYYKGDLTQSVEFGYPTT